MAESGRGASGGTGTRGRSRRLSPDEVAELRRWALRVSGNGSNDALRSAAKAVVKLADQVERLSAPDEDDDWSWGDGREGKPPSTPSPEQLAKARSWARSVLGNGSSSEMKAAARAILLLSDDVEELQQGRTVPRRTDPNRQTRTQFSRRRGDGGGGLAPQVAVARRRWRRTHPLTVLAALIPLVVLFLVFLIFRAVAPALDPTGPQSGAVLGAAQVKTVSFSVDASRQGAVHWTLDGDDVSTDADFANGRSTYRPGKLADGAHVVEARVGGFAPWSGAKESWSFTVDSTPPKIAIPGNVIQVEARTPYVLKGTVGGDTTLTADGKAVELDDGAFSLSFPSAPTHPVELEAEDAAGNTTVKTVSFTLVPSLPTNPVRAVHVSADAWANDELRAGRPAADRREEASTPSSSISRTSRESSAGTRCSARQGDRRRPGHLRPRAAVQLLHDKGVRVIGRLVAFRDPILAEAAWTARRPQARSSRPRAGSRTPEGYGGSSRTSPIPTFARYNIDIAVAAAASSASTTSSTTTCADRTARSTSMRFPGLEGDAEPAIVDFLAETRKALAADRARSSAPPSSGSPSRGPTRSRRTSRRWRARWTTSPRWSTRPTGGRASTALATPTASRTRSCGVARGLQDGRSAARAPGSCPGCRTSRSVSTTGRTRSSADPRARRTRARGVPAVGSRRHVHDAGARPKAKFPTTGGEKPAFTGRARECLCCRVGIAVVPVLAQRGSAVVPVLMFHQVAARRGRGLRPDPGRVRAGARAPLAGGLPARHSRRIS